MKKTPKYRYTKINKKLYIDASAITKIFDELNCIKTYIDENGNTIQYNYDAACNLKELIYPDG